MLKNISNLGKTLNKAEQKGINGGKRYCYHHYANCCSEYGPQCYQVECVSQALGAPMCGVGIVEPLEL